MFFVSLHNFIRISIPWLFRTCFHTKNFSKCNFSTHYNVETAPKLEHVYMRLEVNSNKYQTALKISSFYVAISLGQL